MSNTSQTTNQPIIAQLIEVSKLEKSRLNARRTVSKDGIDELKASILAHGLMQNLVVTDAGKGAYHVIAGSRRLEALQALQKDGKLPKDHAVSCQVVTEENALERSLAENTARLAMHPADQFEAFAKLTEDGKTPDQIATRFGVPETLVHQRLALGRVAPELLKEYRAEKISLKSLMTFTVTDDQKRQMKVYKGLQGWQKDNPHHIREALTEKMPDADSSLAKFVGIDDYIAAGGKVRKDLFEENVYIEDAALLDKLARAKIEALAARLKKEGWGWVEFAPEWDYQFTGKCGRIHEGRGGKFDPEQIKHAGCYVTIARDGKARIDKGLVKPEHKKLLAKPATAKEAAKAKAEDKDRISDSLRRELRLYRLGAAQQEIAKHPALAYDLLVFHATLDLTDHGGCDSIDVQFRPHEIPRIVGEEQMTAAAARTKALRKDLPLEWSKADTETEQFEAFRKLPAADKAKLLAYCVAEALQPNLCGEYNSDPGAYDVALALTGGNVAAYWRPTKDNFLGRISRDQLLAIGTEVFGENWSKQRTNSKKGELADQLHKAFTNPEKALNPDTVRTLQNWLPAGMAFTIPEKKAKAGKPKKAA